MGTLFSISPELIVGDALGISTKWYRRAWSRRFFCGRGEALFSSGWQCARGRARHRASRTRGFSPFACIHPRRPIATSFALKIHTDRGRGNRSNDRLAISVGRNQAPKQPRRPFVDPTPVHSVNHLHQQAASLVYWRERFAPKRAPHATAGTIYKNAVSSRCQLGSRHITSGGGVSVPSVLGPFFQETGQMFLA